MSHYFELVWVILGVWGVILGNTIYFSSTYIFKRQFFSNRFASIFLDVFAVKVLVTFVEDNRIFLKSTIENSSSLAAILICSLEKQSNKIFNGMKFERDCTIFFFFFSFSSLMSVSLQIKILACTKILRKRITNDAKSYRKHKRVVTNVRECMNANVREWMNIWLNSRHYVEKYANVNTAFQNFTLQ